MLSQASPICSRSIKLYENSFPQKSVKQFLKVHRSYSRLRELIVSSVSYFNDYSPSSIKMHLMHSKHAAVNENI